MIFLLSSCWLSPSHVCCLFFRRRAGGKRLPLWQKTTEDGSKRQAQSLPPSVQYWKRAGSRAHQVSGKRRKPVLLWMELCSTKAQIIESFFKGMETQMWEKAAGHPLSTGMERGITTDFAKKARSQLIKEGNFMAARALDFLVCGAINEPHLPADGSIPNQLFCVRCDQSALATRKHELWECGAAGDIYELEPLVVAEETSTRSATEKVVDELAQQGHLLIRHHRRLKCKACNLYRANRQLSFWNRTPCVPRPCAAEVISQFRNKRQHNESFETVPFPCTSSVNQDILGTHSRVERLSQPVSSGTEGDLAHTQQSITCASPSQVGEHCVRSRYVSAQSHFRGMDGKSRKFDPGKGVVNTPLCVSEPRVPLRSNLDDPEEWELPCADGESAWTKYIAQNLLLVTQSSSVERWGALGLVRSVWWNMGRQLGMSQPRPASKSHSLRSLACRK